MKQVCQDYPIAGFRAMLDAQKAEARATPFRFLYMSGAATERDPAKKPKSPAWMVDYCLMRVSCLFSMEPEVKARSGDTFTFPSAFDLERFLI